MIRVYVYRRASGAVRGFAASGHAGYAEKGYDIVCAAVSALTQTAVNALEAHAAVKPVVRMNSGHLRCALPAALDPAQEERAQIILESMVTGLRGIAREYGDYIEVKEVREP